MVVQAFDGEALKSRLVKLSEQQQLAFGAVCCERLLPNYLAFQKDTGWGDINPIRKALDLVWASLNGQQPSSEEIETLIASCESIIPDSEDFESLYVSSAQDSAFAVCGLLDYLLKSDVNKSVQAAIYATDSVDLYVQETGSMVPDAPDLEQKILSHELMQRELRTQQEDIKSIEQASSLDSEFLTRLKTSWKNNGKSNLDLP